MQTIKNFLPGRYCDELLETFSSESFPWYFSTKSIRGFEMENYESRAFFWHIFKYNSEVTSSYTNLIEPLRYKIEDVLNKKLVLARSKLNLTLPVIQKIEGPEIPHMDADDSSPDYVAIFYPKDSDGDTIIYEQRGKPTPKEFKILERVKPEKNKLIIMPGDQWHSSNTPINSTHRLTLNMVFNIEK